MLSRSKVKNRLFHDPARCLHRILGNLRSIISLTPTLLTLCFAGQHGVGIIFEHTDPKDGGEILVVVKQIVSYGSADRTKMLKVIRSPRVRYAQSGAERQWTGSMCF